MKSTGSIGTMFVAAALAVSATPLSAHEAGDWVVRAGPYLVAPKSDNSDIVDVDDGIALGINATYMFTDSIGIEVLASTPFSHDIELQDGTKVAETKHLPPTVSVQYYFDLGETVTAYAGLGLNYTLFFDEDTGGPLAGTDLELDGSFGLAAQLGAEFEINPNWLISLDLRWIDIDTDAELDGVELTEVEIDPFVAGLALAYRFD